MTDKPKMAPGSGTPPGLELDANGKQIPFEKRTEGGQQRVRENIAAATHGSVSQSIKNPNNEAEVPARMPASEAGKKNPADGPHDLEGQQGGTEGGGHE